MAAVVMGKSCCSRTPWPGSCSGVPAGCGEWRKGSPQVGPEIPSEGSVTWPYWTSSTASPCCRAEAGGGLGAGAKGKADSYHKASGSSGQGTASPGLTRGCLERSLSQQPDNTQPRRGSHGRWAQEPLWEEPPVVDHSDPQQRTRGWGLPPAAPSGGNGGQRVQMGGMRSWHGTRGDLPLPGAVSPASKPTE